MSDQQLLRVFGFVAPVAALAYFWVMFRFLPDRLKPIWRVYRATTFVLIFGFIIAGNFSPRIGMIIMVPAVIVFVIGIFIRPPK